MMSASDWTDEMIFYLCNVGRGGGEMMVRRKGTAGEKGLWYVYSTAVWFSSEGWELPRKIWPLEACRWNVTVREGVGIVVRKWTCYVWVLLDLVPLFPLYFLSFLWWRHVGRTCMSADTRFSLDRWFTLFSTSWNVVQMYNLLTVSISYIHFVYNFFILSYK